MITLKGCFVFNTDDKPIDYEFVAYPISRLGKLKDLKGVKAVYVFLRAKKKEKVKFIYIGETKNVYERLDSGHHRYKCIKKEGATHILIHMDENNPLLRTKEGRQFVEDDLMHYRPACQPERWSDS